jgi:hypothetical protein
MTIKELIETLSTFKDQDAPVYLPAPASTDGYIPINCITKTNGIVMVDYDPEMDY